MEGVLVSAKKEGSTITTTVVTNDKGQFSFPAGKLEPGKYNITIRAAGYTLVGPKTVDVAAGRRDRRHQARQDAQHRRRSSPTREWLISVPGDDRIKLVPARLRRLPYAAARVHRRRITPTNGSRCSRAWAAMRPKACRRVRS